VYLEHFKLNIDNRRDATGLRVTLRTGAAEDTLNAAEDRIGHRFPAQVRAFYSQFDGLIVDDPPFEILPVDDLSLDDQSRIHFATADRIHLICFDCSSVNEAEQWDIVDADTGNHITYTMASFWSNKMWKWIDRRLEFWRGEV
jgi:hypothetical protein